MAKKKGKRRDAPSQKPKQLRDQLHKAEAGLHKAEAKRDKAQARVEALGIIADEIRAQLADIEKADAKAAAEPGSTGAPATEEGVEAKAEVKAEVKAEPTPTPTPKSKAPGQASPRRTRKAQPSA
jgi:hypothetical protein